MPGTIQVSVLGLMDIPSPPQSSSEANPGNLLSLKVAMGNTEYQTRGEGEFSFPVTSLRENLIMTLHDAKGNEISQTVVKTILVVEKRFLDAMVPLEGGGCILLKLQFLLSEEERRRIHKMREYASKRKHGELLETGLKHSASEETIIGLVPHPISELREGGLPDRSASAAPDESGSPLAPPPSQETQEHSEHFSEWDVPLLTEVNKEASKTQLHLNDAQKTHTSSEEAVDSQSGSSESLVSGKLTATLSSPFVKSKEEGTESTDSPKEKNVLEKMTASNVKKMISAFESNSFQGLRPNVGSTTKSHLRTNELRGSWLEEATTNKFKVGQTMPKSNSAGMLSEMNSQSLNLIYTKNQDEEKHSNLAISRETKGGIEEFVELKNNQNYKNVDPGKQKAVSKFLYSPQLPSCEGSNDVLELVKTGETVKSGGPANNVGETVRLGGLENNVGERQKLSSADVKEGSTITSHQRDHEALEDKAVLDSFPGGGYPLDSQTLYLTSDATLSSSSGEYLGPTHNLVSKVNKRGDGILEDHCACEQFPGDYSQSSHGRHLVHTNEIKKDKGALVKDARITTQIVNEPANTEQLGSSRVDQLQSALSVIRGESGCSSCGDDPNELTGALNAKIDVLTYADMEQCLFGSHCRHLCITTGSKQLRDFIEDLIIHTGKCADESLARVNVEEEHVMPADMHLEVIKDENIRDSNSESFAGTSKFKGGLIEQAVRVVILLVACGTLLFNTRQR